VVLQYIAGLFVRKMHYQMLDTKALQERIFKEQTGVVEEAKARRRTAKKGRARRPQDVEEAIERARH
jgi:hypothetical protein